MTFYILWLTEDHRLRQLGGGFSYVGAISRAEIDANTPNFMWKMGADGHVHSPRTSRRGETGHYIVVSACETCGNHEKWRIFMEKPEELHCARCTETRIVSARSQESTK